MNREFDCRVAKCSLGAGSAAVQKFVFSTLNGWRRHGHDTVLLAGSRYSSFKVIRHRYDSIVM